MLTYERRQDDAADDAPLIILMHGRGATRLDLTSLGDYMPRHARVVFPEAPFQAAPWGYGPGSAWYRFLGGNRPEPESFAHSIDELEKFIASFDAAHVVLGGFSQGGTMSLAYALSHPGAIDAVLNFSGFLADHPRVVVDEMTVQGTRFWWGHGRQDSNIPFQLAVQGRAQLEQAGAKLEARDYDIGHWIDPQELADAVAWLAPR